MAGFSSLPWRWLLLAALLYAGLFAFYTWPLLPSLGSALTGYPDGDVSQYVWNVWNFRHQVLAAHNPMYTPLLMYPAGTGLWLHTYTPVLSLLNLPLHQPYLAVNIGLVLSFMGSGVGAAWLAGRWVRQPLLCVLVGFAFAYLPSKMAHWPGHYNLLLTATVPFYVAAYLSAFEFGAGHRWPRVRSRRALVWAGGLLLLTLLSDYYMTAGLLYFSVGYAAWWGLRLGQVRWRRWQPWAVVVVGLVLGHFLSRGLGLLDFDDYGGIWWGGDLGMYVVPPLNSRWLGTDVSRAFWQNPRLPVRASPENVSWLGFLLPLLLLAGLVARARRRAPELPAAPLAGAGTAVRAAHHARNPLGRPRPVPAADQFGALRAVFQQHPVPHAAGIAGRPAAAPGGGLRSRPVAANPVGGLALGAAAGAAGWRVRRIPPARLPPNAGQQHPSRLPPGCSGAGAGPLPHPIRAERRQPPTRHLQPGPAALPARPRQGAARRLHFAGTDGNVWRLRARAGATDPAAGPAPPRLANPGARPTPAELVAFSQRYGRPVFVIEPAYHEQPVHQLLRRWLLPTGYREQSVPDYEGTYTLLLPK